jgi:hypothetical protein
MEYVNHPKFVPAMEGLASGAIVGSIFPEDWKIARNEEVAGHLNAAQYALTAALVSTLKEGEGWKTKGKYGALIGSAVNGTLFAIGVKGAQGSTQLGGFVAGAIVGGIAGAGTSAVHKIHRLLNPEKEKAPQAESRRRRRRH